MPSPRLRRDCRHPHVPRRTLPPPSYELIKWVFDTHLGGSREMKMISSLSLPGILLVLLLFLLSFPIPGTSQANQEYVYHSCNNATSYTPNSIFASNLKSLLSSLSSNSFRTLYYNSTFGRNTDTVYGSFLCRGDVTADVCQYCVQDAAKEILNRCPNHQTAIIWYAECTLRYSNRPFFSTMEASPQVLLTNIANVSDPDLFTQLVTDAMGLIATRAASGNTSLRMFATEEVNFTRSQTLYALVQCTPDISLSDCNRCLDGGIPQVISCCSTSIGARFLRPSCNGRFELYPFYRITAPLSPPPTADAGYVTHDCDNATLYTPNSTFASNLKSQFFSSLSSSYTVNTGFYNSTFGHSTDTVYGSFLCRGDVTANVCQDCVQTAARDILNRCPNERTAIIWYVKCMLRYSSRPFFSTMQTSPQHLLYNTANVSERDRLNQMVRVATVMDRITTLAASGTTLVPMFATEEVNFTTSLTLYTLVQCTPDISLTECNKCLRDGIPDVIVCCVTKLGAQFLRPSCHARFEVFPFYGIPATPGGNGIKSKIVIIITVSTLAAILLLGSFVYGLQRWITWQKRKKDNTEEVQLYEFGTRTNTELPHGNFRSEESRESQDFPSIPLSILWLATENFSNENKLGEGGFGPVYKGMLPDGKEIAVKRLARSSAQGIEEFKNEVILIIKLQHKNLVRLLGCCLEGNEMMLVYEYMPNSSLDVFLFEDEARRAQLDWKRRRSIIGGIARGLMYLHEDSRLRIIHRDLKPSNVLLDNAMNPKISDFGIARIFAETQSQANTKRVVGTYGYMAPEYAMEGLFSMKSDVFSFGVILLEIISGRKNSGFHLSEHGRSLLLHAWSLWCEGKGLELMDPLIEKSCETSEVLKCIHIGLLCVQEDAEDRPTMSTIVVMLATDTITLPRPTQPAFSVGRVGARMRQSSKSPMDCSINEVTLSNVEPR